MAHSAQHSQSGYGSYSSELRVFFVVIFYSTRQNNKSNGFPVVDHRNAGDHKGSPLQSLRVLCVVNWSGQRPVVQV